MPIYEYHCQACQADVEIMHKISDPVPKKCPECGKLKLVKQVSAAGFRLSGSGWYETDFKSDKDKKKNLVGEASEPAAPSCPPGGCEQPACAAAAPAAEAPAKAKKTKPGKPAKKKAAA